MSRQEQRVRLHETIQYAANSTRSAELARGGKFRELHLRLQGQVTVTAGNNTAAKTNRGDEWAVIRELTLRANGDTILRYMTADELRFYNYLMYSQVPMLTAGIGDATTADPSFDSTLILPLWSPKMARPWDTILESNKLARIDLDVRWGNEDDISDDATAFTVNPTLEVTVVENNGGPEDPDPAKGLAHPLTEIVRMVETPSGANTNFRVKLPVGEQKVYERFIINTQNSSGVDVNTLVTDVKLVSGPVTLFSEKYKTILQSMRQRWQIPSGWDGGSAAIQRLARSTANHQDGWIVLDLCGDGRATEGISAADLPELYLEFNVAAQGTINILPICRKQM